MERSFDSMKLALSLAVFLVYLVMASQFESLLHPFVILGSVPLSLVGVLGTLWLFDVRLSIVVLIGVVLLAGIVVNNAILLVDTANRLRKEGLTPLRGHPHRRHHAPAADPHDHRHHLPGSPAHGHRTR